MNTAEFIREYAEQYNVAIQAADVWVRTILEFLSEQVVANDEMKLAKFGVFKHSYVPAQGYMDFQTGEWKTSKPKMTVKFTMGRQMETGMKDVPVPADAVKQSRRKSEVPTRQKKNATQEGAGADGSQDTVQSDYESGEARPGEPGEHQAEE